MIKTEEQNSIILRCSLNAVVVTSQQNERTLPTRLSKLNKSTYVCCSNLVGQYFKDKQAGRKMREPVVGRVVRKSLDLN